MTCARKPLPCLLDAFAGIKSTRSAKGTRYPLNSVVALVLVAVLSGSRNYSQIFAFGKAHPRLLGQLGFHPPKYPTKPQSKGRITSPNEDTLGSIMAGISSHDLNTALVGFLQRMVGRGAQAAVDGKALRGADEHVLSVFVNDICQVVWQEDVGQKENELSCLERSLKTILERYPKLRLFTGDAAFCHKSIARALVEARREYFLQLKAPHETDLAVARDAFDQLRHTPALAHSEEKRGARTARKS
jgi:hypothetical protein